MNNLIHCRKNIRFKKPYLFLSNRRYRLTGTFLLGLWLLTGMPQEAPAQDSGVSASTVHIGGVMALEGPMAKIGLNAKIGIDAAIKDEIINGRKIKFTVLNDSYIADDTIAATDDTVVATRKLIGEGIFAMVGNVGSHTASASLPILAKNNVPAVGFFTGSELLRPGVGDILNYRASYAQEVALIVDIALQAGIKPKQICAFAQNDQYGISGVIGIKSAISGQPDAKEVIAKLDQIIATTGKHPKRNNIGPVGFYKPSTVLVRHAYKSLKAWEKTTGAPCRLVVTIGAFEPVSFFIAYARKLKREPWVISALSLTGDATLAESFEKHSIKENIIVTQVVPVLDSTLPIVQDARKALGDKLNYISLEGYITGRMFTAILDRAGKEPTRKSFIDAAKGKKFDLGGLTLDFTDDNQGSDFISLTLFQDNKFTAIEPSYIKNLFKQ